jgi:DNA-binding NtrC family response regulator
MHETSSDILIVDDDMDVRELLAEILVSRGHHVRMANDGREGLSSLHDRLPDAVVLDVEMPHLTGPEMVYRMIVEDAGMEGVPVVLVSGIEGLPAVASQVGTPYFLGKPFAIDALLELLQRALNERRPPVPRWTKPAAD